MAIFISYNHGDRNFVETLAKNLVTAKHNVWIDRWELSLGDSLTQKIQGALTRANAILVILSKNSVESEWCKRELSASLIRELEEQQTLVMPCVIDDCTLPLFIRDKLYADFRRDPDEAFDLVDRSLARISNPLQGREEQPTFHTDWAVDWRRQDPVNHVGPMVVRWAFVDHGHDWPYVISSQCEVILDEKGTKELVAAQKSASHPKIIRSILKGVIDSLNGEEVTGLITDNFEKHVFWKVTPAPGRIYPVFMSYRRMGIDNGMDTLVHLGNYLNIAMAQMDDRLFEPPNAMVGKKKPGK